MKAPVGVSSLLASPYDMGKETSNKYGCHQSKGKVHPHGNRHDVHPKRGLPGLQDVVDHQDHTTHPHTDTHHVPRQIALAKETFGQALEEAGLGGGKLTPA